MLHMIIMITGYVALCQDYKQIYLPNKEYELHKTKN